MPTPLIVRFRPTGSYLSLLVISVGVIVIGAVRGGVFGVIVIVCGSVLAAALGYPVVAGIVFRRPAVMVGPDGIRLPLMGVRLSWAEIADVRTGLKANGRTPVAVLLVVPTDPAAVVRQAHWWLRRQARADLARFGAPVVIDDRSLDHSLEEIRSAVRAHT